MTYEISDNKVASALYAGFAEEVFGSPYIKPFDGLMLTIGKGLDKVDKWLSNIPGWGFFKQWFGDDPVGATAGAILGGVLLVVGGKAVAALGGSALTAFKGLGLLGKAKAILGGLTLLGVIGTTLRLVVRGTQFLWNFNWNETDAQIVESQKALVNSLYGQFGAALGTAAASLLCGTAPVEIAKRAKVVKVNPAVLARMKEISEGGLFGDDVPEIYEEMVEQIRSLVRASGRVLSQIVFKQTYKNIRKAIKGFSKNSGLAAIFPDLAKLIERWGAEGSKPWSFASAIENAIEGIKDPNWQNFAEELYENFTDVCTENMMVVSYAFG